MYNPEKHVETSDSQMKAIDAKIEMENKNTVKAPESKVDDFIASAKTLS